MQRAVDERLERQRGRNGQAVVHVTQPGPADRGVHGQQERVEAVLRCPIHQIFTGAVVTPDVELEPLAGLRRRGGEILDGRRRHGRQCHRNAVALGDAGDRGLAFVVHHAGEPRWGESERQGRPLAEDLP